MRVTVCELSDEREGLRRDWIRLVEHVQTARSELVLLPEMPFSPWIARSPIFDLSLWEEAILEHYEWCSRLPDLAPAVVLGTRPITGSGGRRVNEAFLWRPESYLQAAHQKFYLPDDEGFWEASWYQRGTSEFLPVNAGQADVGFLICSELWFFERARAYGKAGIHILANPRATLRATLEKWLVGGRAAAVVSGAYCLSSNHANVPGREPDFGGMGWIVGPDGDVLARTSPSQPFATLDVDLSVAVQAKGSYPRYIEE